jgi:hypothetical protein
MLRLMERFTQHLGLASTVDDDTSPTGTASKRRNKRGATKLQYTNELLVVTDYSIHKRFVLNFRRSINYAHAQHTLHTTETINICRQ